MIVIVKDTLNDTEQAFSGNEDQVEDQLRQAFPGVALLVEMGDLDTLIYRLGSCYGKIIEVPEGHVAKPELHLPLRFDPTPHFCGAACNGLAKSEEVPFVDQLDGWLLEKAISDIKPGERLEGKEANYKADLIPSQIYDYSHVVPEHLKHKYRIEVHERPRGADRVPGGTYLEAFAIKHPFHFAEDDVGKVSGMVHPKYKNGDKDLRIALSDIYPEHRGQKLGVALYEAVMTHAKHYHGVTHCAGGMHSSMAHRTHESLAKRHGMEYAANFEGSPDYDDFGPGEFDDAYGPYMYAIKNEAEIQLIKADRTMFKEAGFRNKDTNEIAGTGVFHNIYELPEHWKVDEDHLDHIEAGFIDHGGKFYNRAEAAAHTGAAKPLQSEDIEGMGRKPGEEELGGGAGLVKSEGPTRVYRMMHHSGAGPYDLARLDDTGDWDFLNEWKDPNPPASTDFSLEDWKHFEAATPKDEYDPPGYLYAFEKPEHAEQWFGKENVEKMAQHGVVLHEVPAQSVIRSQSGKQVYFKPTPQYPQDARPHKSGGDLVKMAIADIPPGIEKKGQKKYGLTRYSKFFDYSHVLSPLQKRHYFLTAVPANGGGGPKEREKYRIYCYSRRLRDYRGWPLQVGDATARIHDFEGGGAGEPYPEQGYRAVSIDDVRVHQRYRNKGLGTAIYEAAFAHAKHHHNATHVTGGKHSTLASAVHRKLAAKHGLDYHPVHNEDDWGDMKPTGGAYDQALGPYQYALKSEPLQKMALADIRPGEKTTKPVARPYARTEDFATDPDGEWFDYSHVLPQSHANNYEIHVNHFREPGAHTLTAHLYHTYGPMKTHAGFVSGDVLTDPHTGVPDSRLNIMESNVDTFHRGKGLGTHLYESLLAHAYHKFGIRQAGGAHHSSMASRAHQKLADKHGFDGYKPIEHKNVKRIGAYDDRFGGYNYTLKSEDDSWLALADNLNTTVNDDDSELVEDMSGFAPRVHSAFEAARFLVNGRESLSLDQIRRALWLEDGDFERAALRAYGIEPDETHLGSLRAIMKLGFLTKFEHENPQRVDCPVPFSATACSEVQRGISSGLVQHVNLNGKYSKGSMVVRDPKSQHVYLLKPNSEGTSPAAGVNEQPDVSQPRREAAYWHVADMLGMGNMVPRSDLVTLDGEEWAAIRLLPYNFKNLEKRWKIARGEVMNVLERYRAQGTLHKWAALDYILGNPDRHGQNLMIGHGEKFAPTDRDIMLIDHGSAFAGYAFAPSADANSFIPFYLRAWAAPSGFNKLPPEDKLRQMPTVSHDVVGMLKRFVEDLNPTRIEKLVKQYGIDPGPILMRISKLKALPDSTDIAINKLWAGSD